MREAADYHEAILQNAREGVFAVGGLKPPPFLED
jgi:hypothetical protein